MQIDAHSATYDELVQFVKSLKPAPKRATLAGCQTVAMHVGAEPKRSAMIPAPRGYETLSRAASAGLVELRERSDRKGSFRVFPA